MLSLICCIQVRECSSYFSLSFQQAPTDIMKYAASTRHHFKSTGAKSRPWWVSGEQIFLSTAHTWSWYTSIYTSINMRLLIFVCPLIFHYCFFYRHLLPQPRKYLIILLGLDEVCSCTKGQLKAMYQWKSRAASDYNQNGVSVANKHYT